MTWPVPWHLLLLVEVRDVDRGAVRVDVPARTAGTGADTAAAAPGPAGVYPSDPTPPWGC